MDYGFVKLSSSKVEEAESLLTYLAKDGKGIEQRRIETVPSNSKRSAKVQIKQEARFNFSSNILVQGDFLKIIFILSTDRVPVFL